MGLSGSSEQTKNQLWDLLYSWALLNKVALALLCSLCLLLFFYALYKAIKRRWSSVYFILLCVFILLWAGSSLLILFQLGDAVLLNRLGIIGILPVPALLCLHIRQQVSYKDQRALFIVLLLVVPTFLIFVICRDLLFPRIFVVLPAVQDTLWYTALFYLYAIAALIRAYLLCFNVLYQMPRRTRRSTRYMLVSVTAIVLLLALVASWSDELTARLALIIKSRETLEILLPVTTPVAFFIVLFPLYAAMREMPASEVIVTSRQFVVGCLSTAILVLSRTRRILDWNKTDWGQGYPLPKPVFKEHIDHYRKRILMGSTSRISPHDENIIIVEHEGVEKHFYLSSHEAGSKKRFFGYILEISEVTPLYTLLRQFETIAYYDHLTRLYNRNAYLECVNTIVSEENMPLLIFVGDVDRLKLLNDSHGHLLGDELLVTAANIIKSAMPINAFLARIGGDEFVMLVPHGSVELADAFVKNVITKCMNTRHEVFGSPSISWGYAIMTSAQQSYNEVFSQADAIMYQYKQARHEFRSSGLLPDAALPAE